MGLDATAQRDLPGAIDLCVGEAQARPLDGASISLLQTHGRSRDGEVEELLAIELAQWNRTQCTLQVSDRRGRSLSCVVPTFEGEQQRRAAQRRLHVEVRGSRHATRVARLPWG